MKNQEYQPIHDPRTEGEKNVHKTLGAEVFDEIIYDCIDYALREVEHAKKLGISLDSDELIGSYIWKQMGKMSSQISYIGIEAKEGRKKKKPNFSGILKFLLVAEQKDMEIERRYIGKAEREAYAEKAEREGNSKQDSEE